MCGPGAIYIQHNQLHANFPPNPNMLSGLRACSNSRVLQIHVRAYCMLQFCLWQILLIPHWGRYSIGPHRTRRLRLVGGYGEDNSTRMKEQGTYLAASCVWQGKLEFCPYVGTYALDADRTEKLELELVPGMVPATL